ncbi:MAG: MTH1187 family thiamine-binding protein [Brevibacillus sp.]|nr:MTH1187 family thiamine-binding protein [Brevibacillus sp.]
MPLLEISVVPVGTNTASFSSAVTEAVRFLEQQGLKYQITPTATIMEGELDQLMEAAKQIHQNALANGVNRVVTNIQIDHRIDKPINLKGQVEIVQQSLH